MRATDLGGQHEILARTAVEGAAEPVLALATAVPGGGVEVADAGVPRGGERRGGFFVGDDVEKIAEAGAAEAELRDFDAGAANFAAGERVHAWSPWSVRRRR